MKEVESAFSNLNPTNSNETAQLQKKFEGGRSLQESVNTPWLEKRPVEEEIRALKALSQSFNIILGNPS
jgi:hypothetical protein